MAKDAYLRDGQILFSDTGAFRTEQRAETTMRLAIRLDRINSELCALPYHPHIEGLKDRIHVGLFGEEVGEMCLMLVRTVAILNGSKVWIA